MAPKENDFTSYSFFFSFVCIINIVHFIKRDVSLVSIEYPANITFSSITPTTVTISWEVREVKNIHMIDRYNTLQVNSTVAHTRPIARFFAACFVLYCPNSSSLSC